MLTTAATYDVDLAAAKAMLADRIAAAKYRAEEDGDYTLARQLDGWLDSELNNTWVEGVEVAGWAEVAASGIPL